MVCLDVTPPDMLAAHLVGAGWAVFVCVCLCLFVFVCGCMHDICSLAGSSAIIAPAQFKTVSIPSWNQLYCAAGYFKGITDAEGCVIVLIYGVACLRFGRYDRIHVGLV